MKKMFKKAAEFVNVMKTRAIKQVEKVVEKVSRPFSHKKAAVMAVAGNVLTSGVAVVQFNQALKKMSRPLQNSKGATMVEIIGYALISIAGIVIIWGLISGWLPTMWTRITGKLDSI